jgi:hypothetical protein
MDESSKTKKTNKNRVETLEVLQEGYQLVKKNKKVKK